MEIFKYTELGKKINQGNKRMAIVVTVWSLITIPFILFFNDKQIYLFFILWCLWIDIGILLSSKIINKLWKH